MDRMNAARPAPLFLACLAFLAAPSASPFGAGGGGESFSQGPPGTAAGSDGPRIIYRRVNLERDLLPHVQEAVDDAFREGFEDPEVASYHLSEEFFRGSFVTHVAPVVAGAAVAVGSL